MLLTDSTSNVKLVSRKELPVLLYSRGYLKLSSEVLLDAGDEDKLLTSREHYRTTLEASEYMMQCDCDSL